MVSEGQAGVVSSNTKPLRNCFVDKATGKILHGADFHTGTNPQAIRFTVVGPRAGDDADYSRKLFAASLDLTPAKLSLPWETSMVLGKFQSPFDALNSRFSRPNLSATMLFNAGTFAEHDAKQVKVMTIYPSAVKRMRDMKPSELEDALRSKALGRWLIFLSICPECSGAGRTMIQMIGRLKTDADLNSLLEDLCARKAPSTLLKRAGSMLKMVMYCRNLGLPALPLDEQTCVDYCKYLEQSPDQAATSIASFRQALNFAASVFHLDSASAIASNGAIAGMCHKKLLNKRVLRQSAVFTVTAIVQLMVIVITPSFEFRARIFAGSVLFCIFGRSRWGDHQFIECLEWDECDGGSFGGFVQGNTRRSKTSQTAQQRTQFLPLTAPLWDMINIPTQKAWWHHWRELREEAGLVPEHGKPFMPAPSLKGGWCERALSAGEASGWIRELLTERGLANNEISSHGCKATLLSWLAKRGVSPDVRLILGYHKSNTTQTALHYSRDALAGPLQILNDVIWEVIDGKFFPDRNRAQYFNQDEQPKRRGKSFVNPEGSSGLAHSDGDQAMFIDDGEELAVRLSEHDWEMVHALSSESREVVDEYPDELQADEVEPVGRGSGTRIRRIPGVSIRYRHLQQSGLRLFC